MPRGYELNSYYDALRAVNRTIFSREIRILSGVLDKIGFRYADTYKLIISSINKGVYDNLGALVGKTHFGNNPQNLIGKNKSSYDQDFMSPMELRMCAVAVRRASKQIQSLKGGFTLRNIQDICYSAGEEVASEFVYLTQGKQEFGMKISEPVLSTKPIIKKYNHALVMGTLPTAKKFTYQNQEDLIALKQELIFKNNQLFAQIKHRLIELGLYSGALREKAFAMFNSGYYDMEIAREYTLEITKIILTDKQEDYISLEELELNIHKLQIMKNTLDRLGQGVNFSSVFNALEKSGTGARYTIMQKYKTLPELYSGFYHTYISSNKKFADAKFSKERAGK